MNTNQKIIDGILAYLCSAKEFEDGVEKFLKDNAYIDKDWEEFSYWLSQFDVEKNVS